MSSRSFLIPGLDLASLPSDATNSQIQQALAQAYPAAGLGLLIYQAGTPDVATYPEYVTFIWVNTTTGELKYWNGTSWQLIVGLASVADNSLTLAKLSPSGGTALQLIRINAAGTAFEFVNGSDIFNLNSLPVNRLVNAAAAGYVLYSTTGGVWSSADLNTLLATWLATANIPISRVIDVSGDGLPNQVAYIADTFNPLQYAYVESLLRANQTLTNRLQFAAGAADKWVKVNAGGTDFDYADTPAGKAALLKYTGVTNTAAQAVSATTETVVEFNSETDPEGIVSFDSGTNQITLATGRYLLDIVVPCVHPTTPYTGILMLYDNTGATIAASLSFSNRGDDTSNEPALKVPVTVSAASNVYTVRVYSSLAISLGKPANLGTYPEVYSQLSILKLT